MGWQEKRITKLGLAAAMLLSSLSPGAFAEELRAPAFADDWSASSSCVIRLGPGDARGDASDVDRPERLDRHITVKSNFLWDAIYVDESTGFERGRPDRSSLQVIPVAGAVSGMASADFNRDGIADVAVADFFEKRVDVLFGSVDGRLITGSSIGVGAGPVRIIASDLNSDGLLDLATANLLDETITIAAGRGNGQFNAPVSSRPTETMRKSAVFTPAASLGVDYTALKSAVSSTRMSESTRRRLTRYLKSSESGNAAGNKRKAIGQLERFVRLLKGNRDSQLSETGRQTLVSMAEDLINQLLGRNRLQAKIEAVPARIAPAGSTTLRWSSAGAVSATIDNGIGSVSPIGSTTVSPAATTTYTLTVTSASGQKATATAEITVAAAGSKIHVDVANGSDTGGDGTATAPYRSIGKALSVATSGSVVSVASGAYDAAVEAFPLSIPDGVTLLGSGAAQTYVIGGDTGEDGFDISMSLGAGSTLDSICVMNPGGSGVWMTAAAQIKNCRIQSCGGNGVTVYQTGALEMTGSSVANVVWDAVWLAGTATATLTSNTLSHNGDRALVAYYTPGPITMTSNTLDRNGTGFGLLGAQVFLDTVSGTTISGNAISTDTWFNGYFGIIAWTVSDCTISNNTIQMLDPNNGYGFYAVGGTTGSFTSNSVDGGYRSMRSSTSTTNMNVSNNTFTWANVGIRISGGTGTYRGNSVTGCTAGGVRISGGTPDFGTLTSHGDNAFHNLVSGCYNMWNYGLAAIEARFCAWDHTPPTTSGACHMRDIIGTVNY